ncbi:hotdog fold thioesterase [Aureispira anguillae]|uniref:Hotdog fold thioesterase n=1 Tax=Aureispira anguillae TaxID=2864201 RepID=A0A915YDJ6_9BACT|nr:hotdog fold thioesterase [Aureispira anguillae]BDS11089.1 hotdog fold thioesterase [Aureispira anguillae]
MDSKEKAHKIAEEQMYNQDAFSQWLGIDIVALDAGQAVLKMVVRKEMTNGFGIAHGGITYSLADSALAFAANAHGRQSVSVETSISHTQSVKTGDELTATACEESLSHKIGVYRIIITNQEKVTVAVFKGVVYRSSKEWPLS